MSNTAYDLIIVGGGINGTGIAADAAGRGLRVLLAEQNDLASGTSSASSKLIHGGLRYLEHYEFRLVREALGERDVLRRKAPHLIWPLRFVLPHVASMRSPLLVRAGLFLYDTLAPRGVLGRSQRIDLLTDPAGAPLQPEFAKGFSYWDCWVDDARLVIANALAARDQGAEILTRTKVTDFVAEDGLWRVRLLHGNAARKVYGRAVVNAAGPWAGIVAHTNAAAAAPVPDIKLVKGSHIVVPRIAGADDAYLLQNDDGRVVFALPFEAGFTLIGTTDIEFTGDPATVAISRDEQRYLLSAANRFFRQSLTSQDVVQNFSGVRPLADDGAGNPSSISRDYVLRLDAADAPPLLTVIGGKITTYRRLAEAALEKLAPAFPGLKPVWTSEAPLPGGDLGGADFTSWFARLVAGRPDFDAAILLRLARRYGSRIDRVIGDTKTSRGLGPEIAAGLTLREIAYLKSEEWAAEPEDILWRRTKAGLGLTPQQQERARDAVQAALDRSPL